MSNAQLPALIKANVRQRFYTAVVFLLAITQAYTNDRQATPPGAQWSGDSSSKASFKDFVNKLSQFCDVKPGGDSVTAFTVLDHQDHFEYRFACNKMKKSRLTKIAEYMTDLLKTLHHVRSDDEFRSLLLQKVLCFCRHRVHYYLGAFATACRACKKTRPTDERLVGQLCHCLEAASKADSMGMPEDQWVPLCDALMTIIEEYYRASERSIFAKRETQGIMNPGPNCWSELRHYAGRLRSYSQGIGTLIAAAQTFPMLFENFKVKLIMSSIPDGNPIQKKLPASRILGTMARSREEAGQYTLLFESAQALSLTVNNSIQEMMADETFKPIVHAELLVLQSLERDGLTRPSSFFNSWKYIGSSKPTCRLCHHYFTEHRGGFEVRPTHGNLYINWKPPDVFQRDGEEAIRARENMLNAIVIPIRREALRTLDEQVPQGRPHDSSTGMTFPIRTRGIAGDAAGPLGAGTNEAAADDDMETNVGE